MKEIFLVGAGGMIGSISRMIILKLNIYNISLPLNTFLVNIIGCFIVGILIKYSAGVSKEIAEYLNYFLIFDLCSKKVRDWMSYFINIDWVFLMSKVNLSKRQATIQLQICYIHTLLETLKGKKGFQNCWCKICFSLLKRHATDVLWTTFHFSFYPARHLRPEHKNYG